LFFILLLMTGNRKMVNLIYLPLEEATISALDNVLNYPIALVVLSTEEL
jgi:hypothetical protein